MNSIISVTWHSWEFGRGRAHVKNLNMKRAVPQLMCLMWSSYEVGPHIIRSHNNGLVPSSILYRTKSVLLYCQRKKNSPRARDMHVRTDTPCREIADEVEKGCEICHCQAVAISCDKWCGVICIWLQKGVRCAIARLWLSVVISDAV
jgi:hypothetical protein